MAGNQVSSRNASNPLPITSAIQLVTSVSISPSIAQTKNIGETFTITPTVGPSNANNKNVNWTSSNTSVATISKSSTASGTAITVTCKAAGTTTITATAADGSGKSANLSLKVINPVTALSLNKDQTTLQKSGASTTVTATVTPSSYTNVEWSISNTSIATITPNGTTCTIKPTSTTGTATLTAKAGSKTATCTVNVVNFTTTTYSYTGSVQSVTLPAGTYKLEVWGAQGGYHEYTSKHGGKGGYSIGMITLSSPTTLYIVVGEQGKTGQSSGINNSSNSSGTSYNGGGSGRGYTSGGGGATHIATRNGILSSLNSYKSDILIVAGGGGGLSSDNSANYGGGTTAGAGTFPLTAATSTTYGTNPSRTQANGSFGQGGSIDNYTSSIDAGGGGGGYYGGAAHDTTGDGNGGGGSGYINTSKLTSASTKAGNISFPNVTGTGNEIGHSGNGAAKITPIN